MTTGIIMLVLSTQLAQVNSVVTVKFKNPNNESVDIRVNGKKYTVRKKDHVAIAMMPGRFTYQVGDMDEETCIGRADEKLTIMIVREVKVREVVKEVKVQTKKKRSDPIPSGVPPIQSGTYATFNSFNFGGPTVGRWRR